MLFFFILIQLRQYLIGEDPIKPPYLLQLASKIKL